MRKVMDDQFKIGQVAIADIDLDIRSRDEIPKLLMGLKGMYCDTEIRNELFAVLTELIPEGTDPNNGRTGMDLWKILVLGTLRLCCNWDYDKVAEIANNHRTLRLMLGHSSMDSESRYPLQTIKDNVSLFTPEVLDKVNLIAVKYGKKILGVKPQEKLHASCDSFVVETDVHYPTDINLLLDSLRKVIFLIMFMCARVGLPGWREGKNIFKKVKALFRKAQQAKRSKSKSKKTEEMKEQSMIAAHLAYLDLASSVLEKVGESLLEVSVTDAEACACIIDIEKYIGHAERQMDQIRRRVVEGETIPHDEKVFSIFEEHTEWIVKGKAGVPQELGLKVCVVKDQFGFILHYRVMQNETDVDIAVPIIEETKSRFPSLSSCSFDKGFHSPSNQEKLPALLEKVVLPRKGKLSAINQEIESSPEFIAARRRHSIVESSIAALENHGLDRCPDHGLEGFKRYVGLSVLARNIQIAGHARQQKEIKRLERLGRRNRKRYSASG